MTAVTAIIQRYYPERLGYIRAILDSLAGQTVKPDRVILWNNFMEEDEGHDRDGIWGLHCGDWDCSVDIHLMYSHVNTLMGRWAAVLLAETKYVLIQDDDLLLGPDTVERLLAESSKHFGTLVGPFGMNCGLDAEKPYTSGRAVASGPCDVVLGRCLLASKAHLLRRLAVAAATPMGRCDDIRVSLASPAMNYAVPGCTVTNLDERGIGLSHEPGHFAERNAAALAVRSLHA